VAFQGVESRRPQLAVRPEPLVELLQRFGADAVQPALGIDAHVHHARVAQHAEVLRHRRLAHAQRRDQLADRSFPGAQQIEDPSPIGFGQHLERDGAHRANITRELYTCQAIRVRR
jgi:hypothetical protein